MNLIDRLKKIQCYQRADDPTYKPVPTIVKKIIGFTSSVELVLFLHYCVVISIYVGFRVFYRQRRYKSRILKRRDRHYEIERRIAIQTF